MAVFKKHSQALRKTGNVSEFLQSLEGSLQRELGKASQKQDPKALDIDRENQLVVEKGLEKEKILLNGKADRSENIPKNTVSHKSRGKFKLEQASDFNYPIGTEMVLSFRGFYHGKEIYLNNIIVKVVETPFKLKKGTFIKVKYAFDQEVQLDKTDKKIYFLSSSKSFYVKVK